MSDKRFDTVTGKQKRYEASSASLYTYGRKKYPYKKTEEDANLPYGVGFRLRMIFCMVLFLSFLFFDHYILEEETLEMFYQKVEGDTSKEEWENYAVMAFNYLKEIK